MPDSLSPARGPKPVRPIHHELETRTAEHWQARAAEARTLAAQMADDLSCQTMENIAASYDKLADWAERRQR